MAFMLFHILKKKKIYFEKHIFFLAKFKKNTTNSRTFLLLKKKRIWEEVGKGRVGWGFIYIS